MTINDAALTYEERKTLGFGVQKLVDDRIVAIQAQLDKFYARRRELTTAIESIDKDCEPLLKERNTLKAAREKLSW